MATIKEITIKVCENCGTRVFGCSVCYKTFEKNDQIECEERVDKQPKHTHKKCLEGYNGKRNI